MAAGVTFQEDTVPARVATNEAELARVKNQLRKLEQKQATTPTTPNRPVTSSSNAGHSPYYPNQQGYTQGRDQDRMRRYLANRRGGRGRRSYYPRNNDYQKQPSQPTTSTAAAPQESSTTEHAAMEDGLPLESEYESDYDGEETLTMYKEYLLDKELAGLAEFRDLKNGTAEN